jgi:hypothetical protein
MPEPVAVLATYLVVVYDEALRRGYRFAASKIAPERSTATLTATDGQLRYEWRHLQHKLRIRDPRGRPAMRRWWSPSPTRSFAWWPDRSARGNVDTRGAASWGARGLAQGPLAST